MSNHPKRYRREPMTKEWRDIVLARARDAQAARAAERLERKLGRAERRRARREAFQQHKSVPNRIFPLTQLYAPYVATEFGWYTNSTGTVVPENLSVYKAYRDQVGTVTPGFFSARRRKQKLPENTFRMHFQAATSSGYSRRDFQRFFVDGQYVMINTQSSSAPMCFHIDWRQRSVYRSDGRIDDTKRLALLRVGRHVNDMKVNLGQVFAERKQTMSLISNTAVRLASAASALRSANWTKFSKALSLSSFDRHGRPLPLSRTFEQVLRTPVDKRIANHWLEYTFGWVPLLNDVYGAAELLASHTMGDFYHEVAVGSAKKSISQRFRSSDGYLFDGTMREEVKVRYKINYRLDSYGRAALSQTGLSNPALLAWELAPYSFVVDWFYNVSSYLKQLYVFDGFECVSGTLSTTWKAELMKSFSRTIRYPDESYSDRSGSSLFRESTYERTALSSFPSAIPPKFTNPLENGPLWKLVTSTSLLAQVFR